MSITTNGVLFYGYCWDEETDMPWTIGDDDPPEESESWEDRYIVALCHDKPLKDKERHRLLQKTPCVVDIHCAGTYPMPLVAVRASMITANRGDMKEVKSLDVGKTWGADLDTFCELMGIKPNGKPRWWLVAYWDGQ